MMNEKFEQTVLRSVIIQLIFTPRLDDKKRRSWLSKYALATSRKFGIEGFADYKVSKHSNQFRFGNMVDIDLVFDSYDQFDATLMVGTSNLWAHHVDSKYRTHHNEIIANLKDRKDVIKITTLSKVKSILEDLLVHPEVHQHISIPELPHEFRLGGGISNVYQFLIHLRIQLYPDIAGRDQEIENLANKIFDHLQSGSINVIDQSQLLG